MHANYSVYLKNANLGFSDLSCSHCGAPVLSLRKKEAVCHFCEGYATTTREELLHENEVLYSGLFKVHDLIMAGATDEAQRALDAAIPAIPDSEIAPLYGAANIYALLSDYKYYALDYNGKGFMEENSKNIYASLDLTARSKLLLYRALKKVQAADGSASDESLLYLEFISYIKLKRIADAKKTLYKFKDLKAAGFQYEYAQMVYAVIEEDANASKCLKLMLDKNVPSAFYYLAKYIAKTTKKAKERSEARSILTELMKKCYMPSAAFLLRKIEEAQEETKL